MYPYEPYDNNSRESEPGSYFANAQDRSRYYPTVQEPQAGPGIGGSSPEKKKKKNSKLASTVALAAALIVTASAAGGGTAYWVLNNAQVVQEVSVSGETDGGILLQSSNTPAASPSEAGSVTAVAQVAADSVVEIDTRSTQSSYFFGNSLIEGSGSGVIISEDGYIVTNNHVVDSADSYLVRTSDGTEYEATLIGTDSQTDLAVLKVEASGLKAITFADSDNIQVGDLAVAIGNPLGELGGTVTSGIISATGREITIEGGSMTLLQTSAAINPGNSGGGLFDANGNLIGVVNAKSYGVEIEGLGFAIPSNTVKTVASDIIDKGYVTGRPIMGIQVVEVNDSRTAMMYGVNKAGVYVADPGDNEGLRAGDRFVFIAGESIEGSSDISNVLRKHTVGDTISVTVERDGRAVETSITLKESTPEATATEQLPDPDDL